MKNIKDIIGGLLVLASVFFVSCSGDSYLNAVPGDSRALISLDLTHLQEAQEGGRAATFLKRTLGVVDPGDCGLDLKHKLYLFESGDGTLGLCAKVDDEDDLTDCFDNLAKRGLCVGVKKYRKCHFTLLKNAWVAGWSDEAFLVMGPVTPSAAATLQQQMAEYLKEDEDQGVKSQPLFDRLDSIDAPMAMVTQAQALPDQFVAPFVLGAPQNADPSEVLISATLQVKKGILNITGKTFSFDGGINEALQKAQRQYRPIQGHYLPTMPSTALFGMFMNVHGPQFLPLMQADKGLQAILMGVNQAIDMDNIIRSVNGDMAIVMPKYSEKDLQLTMAAKLANSNWTKDVSYWKQSVPKGGKISDWRPGAWYYSSDKTSFYFGVSKDLQFYSGSSAALADHSLVAYPQPLNPAVQQLIRGKRVAMVINLGALGKGHSALTAVSGMLEPLFGKVNTIVYVIK